MIFILINQIDVSIRLIDMISVGFSRNVFTLEVKVLVNALRSSYRVRAANAYTTAQHDEHYMSVPPIASWYIRSQ